MTGTLYGVGVGPGDPEMLTLKALRIIRENQVIAVPGEIAEESIAYRIVFQIYPELAEKTLMALPMPMTKDKAKLEQNHQYAAERIEEILDQGENVVFLTLGDPTVYSTYLYVHKKVVQAGYPAEIISGITSFCAVAARMNMGLVEKSEELHVIPASYQIEEALDLSGTRVLMKAGKKMGQVKQVLQEKNLEACMIENCGMPEEKIYASSEEIPDNAGYYSLIIIKDKGER